jgi:outer membrane protein assembly factor BamB
MPTRPCCSPKNRGGAALAVRDGRLGAVLLDGTTILVEIDSAATLWRGRVQESDSWALRFDERGLYALGNAGAAGFTVDGRRLWNLRLDGSASPPTLTAEGLLYSGGDDWILYAYRVEERVRERTDILYASGETGTYGLGGLGADKDEGENANPFALSEANIQERLEFIAKAIDIREVGEQETEFAEYLRRIAGSERSPVRRRELPAVLPTTGPSGRVDRRAGLSETVPFLADVFRRDPESVVRATAAAGYRLA